MDDFFHTSKSLETATGKLPAVYGKIEFLSRMDELNFFSTLLCIL